MDPMGRWCAKTIVSPHDFARTRHREDKLQRLVDRFLGQIPRNTEPREEGRDAEIEARGREALL
jgi:hypothetical protein